MIDLSGGRGEPLLAIKSQYRQNIYAGRLLWALDEEIILARFGEPDECAQLDEATHFLYLEKGLDIALHDDAKEVMPYVLPNDFQHYD